jgi:hypothetical protein
VLKRWEDEARLLDVATAENMDGGEPSQLPEVRVAIDLLCTCDRIEERAPA